MRPKDLDNTLICRITMNTDAYKKLISLSHHRSSERLPMPEQNRAAQFAPFAALSGYENVIRETERRTQKQPELSEDRLSELNEHLQQLADHTGSAPQVSITYFVPDKYKAGGSLRTVCGTLKRIDPVFRRLLLTDGTEVPLDTVTDLAGELWDKF